MKDTNKDNFSFFIDNVTIEKSKSEDGRDIMKVGGIATTKAKDSDEEEIDPLGWDVSYFLNSGFFNYNHQSKFNPKAVIGEPTKAKVTKEGVYVEGFLYSDSELAKSVYDTTKMLENSSSTRRMGFSIEGKALERDPFNEKKITKARLTGCALTLNPKNPNTFVNIIKGEYHTDEYEYDYEGIPEEVKSIIEKSEEYIIHLERDGKVVQVDKDLNIKITESKQVEKSLDTSSAAPIITESVDQDVKNKEKLPKTKNYLTKGEVYSEIFSYIYDVNLEKADLMYKIIETNSIKRSKMETGNSLGTPKITREDLQKSLDIVLGVTQDNLEKGGYIQMNKDKKKSEDEDKEEEEDTFEMKMEKAMSSDEEYQKLKKACEMSQKALDDYKSKIEKGELSGYPTQPSHKQETMQEDENGASIGKEGEFLSKSLDNDLVKSINGAIEAGLAPTTQLIQTLAKVTQEVLNKNEELEKGLQSANDANNELKKSLDATLQEVTKIANTPLPSKTVTSQSYRKHPSLEKSEDGGGVVLHAGRDKSRILDILDAKAAIDSSNPNMAYAQSMMAFESSGAIDRAVLDDLKKSENIDIVGL